MEEDNVDLVTYMKYNTDAVRIIGNDRYYANNPGIHMFVWQFAPDAPARVARRGFKFVSAIRVFWDRQELWYYEWCPPSKDCSAPARAYCSQRSAAGPSKREFLAIRREQAAEPTDTPTPTDDTPEESISGAPLPIFWDELSSPEDIHEDDWWRRMYDAVVPEGAVTDVGYHSGDDFVGDDASFLPFGDVPLVTGITPMWGCTGIVVFSNGGIYTARIWEVPTFVVPDEEENIFDYDEESVWKGRVVRLLTEGFVLGSDSYEDVPPLSGLANGTNAFAPDTREWIHAQIITPTAYGNSSETRPRYFNKVAKLRDLLVSILDIDKEDVAIKTYSSGEDQETRGNATFAETEAQFEKAPGRNMLGVHYAPAHPLHADTSRASEVRAVRMWWDREAYLDHFWCPPKMTAILPRNSTASSEIQCVKPEDKEEEAQPEPSELCAVSYVPSLYPYDDMRVELSVGFSKITLNDDGALQPEVISSHNLNMTMGDLVTIPISESGLHKAFHTTVGQPWQRILYDEGYTCRCRDGACDLFSRTCCADDSCTAYACNCDDIGYKGKACRNGLEDVARCCRDEKGCLDDGMPREPRGVDDPIPWEWFEHGFRYGGQHWSSGQVGNLKDKEFPPERPFCSEATEIDNDVAYEGEFGTKDLVWVSFLSLSLSLSLHSLLLTVSSVLGALLTYL